MTVRITIVGGGSTHWGPSLLLDFANHPALCDTEVVLMDIDEAAATSMAELGRRMAERRGIKLRALATTDLERALDGADFVVSAFSVGGFESMRHDIEIPATYGIRQPVGDSVGPGGISRALRSIPVMVELGRSMERICPEALLINVTNPLTALSRAVSRETALRVVGLCNEVVGCQFSMSLLFDVPMHEVDLVIAGVNHLPFATQMRIGDADGFSKLREALDGGAELGAGIWYDPPPEDMHWSPVAAGRGWIRADVLHNLRVKLELFRCFGALPAASDTHVAEFFPGFVTETSDFGRDWGIHHYGLSGHVLDKLKDNERFDQLMKAEKVPRMPSGELVAPLVGALVSGEQQTMPVNLPNAGQVTNLPAGAVVECMGVCGEDGVNPRDISTVPSFLGETLRRINIAQELTVEAALTGDRSAVLEAMFCDPTAGRIPHDQVVSMTDELLTATSRWLPRFA